MGKLRDWWPSDDSPRGGSPNVISCDNTASSGPAQADFNEVGAALSAAVAASSTPSAVTLRLSEVAAALNAMPNYAISSSATTAVSANSTPVNETGVSNPFSPSKPAFKLANTQAHKDDLLKKLLSRSESCSDLQMGLHSQKASYTTSTRPASLPSSPVRASGQQPVAGRKSFSAILEKGTNNKVAEAPSKPSSTAMLSKETNSSAELRKRKRDASPSVRSSTNTSSQETQEQVQTPVTPVATPELSGSRSESLSRREIHIFSERQRRKGMTHLYTILHSLLPDAKPKVDRCTVLTEAMEYIQELQASLNELVMQKNEILASIGEQLHVDLSDAGGALMQGAADASLESGRHARNADDLISEEMREEILAAADVVVRFCGRDAFVTLNSPRRNGVWSAILHVFREQDMELLNVTLSTSNDMDYHCIHAKVTNAELQSSALQKMLQNVVLNHAILD